MRICRRNEMRRKKIGMTGEKTAEEIVKGIIEKGDWEALTDLIIRYEIRRTHAPLEILSKEIDKETNKKEKDLFYQIRDLLLNAKVIVVQYDGFENGYNVLRVSGAENGYALISCLSVLGICSPGLDNRTFVCKTREDANDFARAYRSSHQKAHDYKPEIKIALAKTVESYVYEGD